MSTRILVTGGSGLLGSYLLRYFRKNGYTQLTGTYQKNENRIPPDLRAGVEWKSLRLPDLQDAYSLTAEQDWVIHTAGLVSYHRKDRFQLLDVNQKGTEHIVNACISNQVKQLVYVGSIGALGKEKNHITLDENADWLETAYSTSYGRSKYLGELEVWRGGAEGLKVSVVLPSVILGSGDWSRSSLQLIERVAKRAPWYPGGQTGFVDVRDVATFIGLVLERSLSGERWILSGANVTYGDIYRKIAREIPREIEFREAPWWLARLKLLVENGMGGRLSTPDILRQVYGSFRYDASKSLEVEGFGYRDIDLTIREVVEVYKKRSVGKVLEFD